MTGNPVQSTFWLMILVQTIGSVDMPGKGARKMPAPHSYVAIVILWALLGLLNDLGQQKFAGRLALLLVLTGAVIGPFGRRAVGFLNAVAGGFAVAPATPATPTAATPPPPRRFSA